MTGTGPKDIDQIVRTLFSSNNRQWRFTSLKSNKTSILKQIQKIFNPMAINARRTSLTHEKLHFLHYSVRGVIYALIDVLGHFSVFLQPRNLCKVEFTYICSARVTTRKNAKILQPFGSLLALQSFHSVKYSSCHEFSKVGTFFWLNPVDK